MARRLRIFYAGVNSANGRMLPDSLIWHINFHDTLAGHHELVLPTFSIQAQHAGRVLGVQNACALSREEFSERLVCEVKAAHAAKPVDVFFSYFYSAVVCPGAIDDIRRLGIPTVNFYCNSIHQFPLIAELAPHFDYCMFPEAEAEASYRAVGARPVHIQMAANPAFYMPYPVRTEFPVTFVGARYLNRPDYVGYLFARDVDVRVWGPGWAEAATAKAGPAGPDGLLPRLRQLAKRCGFRRQYAEMDLPPDRCGKSLSDEELVRMYSRSSISLGFSEVLDPSGHTRRHIRLRDFEAPMSGALYFTGSQDELAQYYDIGREIVCYDTPAELLEKVRYYLKHPEEGWAIREAGWRRARRDHTWERRFEQLFAAMGLLAE